MDSQLAQDKAQFAALLQLIYDYSTAFLDTVEERPVGLLPTPTPIDTLSETGIGGAGALELFRQKYEAGITGSAGSRYFGFVTGGSTPAAVMGDWLVSVFDQNAAGSTDSSAAFIEQEAISLLRELFGLSAAQHGIFVSGASMSNFAGLAMGRQWVAHQVGANLAKEGLYGLPPIQILSGSAHASSYKALSMLGMGKGNLQAIPTLPGREAVDVAALRAALEKQTQPCIVVANAGIVNTGDFDDLEAIAALKNDFKFWLHVDAAFGGVVAASPRYRPLTAGMDAGDSICIDAHKWLNVPYDSAMQFTRHRALQVEVFGNTTAAYLGEPTANPDFFHLTPENSRRFRALPAWFTLQAYGRKGYQDIVERCCDLATLLGEKISASSHFRLLAPVYLNILCFTLARESTFEEIKAFLAQVRDDGRAYFTPTMYQGVPAIRAAFSNWRTQAADVDLTWAALEEIATRG